MRKDLDQQQHRESLHRSLFVTSGKLGGMMLFLLVSLQVLAIGAQALNNGLVRVWGISEGMQLFWTSLFPCILVDLFTISVGLVLFAPRGRALGFCAPEPGNSGRILSGIFMSVGASFAAMIAVGIVMLFLEGIGHPLVMPDLAMPRDSVAGALLYVLYLCLLGPFLEEVLFRGIILHTLKPYGRTAAIVVSTLLFAVFHSNPVQLPVALFVGGLLAFLTLETKSIWPAVGAHVFNNSFVSLPEVLFPGNVEMSGWWSLLSAAIGVAALTVYVIRYRKRGVSGGLQQESGGSTGTIRRIARLFSHPLMILMGLLYVGICVLFCFNYIA